MAKEKQENKPKRVVSKLSQDNRANRFEIKDNEPKQIQEVKKNVQRKEG